MKLKCAIVDDEPLALGLLESYAKKTPLLELCGCYSSAIEAMKHLQETPVDLLFLDIQMPDLNGLEYSRMVDEQTRIVYYRFRPICNRRLSGKCARLSAKAYQLCRLYAGGK